jgi:flagellar biogenesis protein FliO
MSLTLRTIILMLFIAVPFGMTAEARAYDAPGSLVYAAASAVEGNSISMPLKPPGPTDREVDKPNGLRTAMTVGGSLAVVLGVFFLVVWLMRRTSSGGVGTLPAEVLEMMGRAPLAGHQQVQLIRFGGKILLVAIGSSGAGSSAQTLTEITDPKEIERLVGLCRQPGRRHAS